MKTFLASVLCLLCALPAYPQKTTENLLAPLIGKYLMFEESLDAAGNPRAGMMFTSESQFYGFDGCRSFEGAYAYNAAMGFAWEEIHWGDTQCLGLVKIFPPEKLREAKSFEITENRVIFYDGAGKELERLFAVENFDENIALPAGDWKLVECNYPSFEDVRHRAHLPCLRLTAEKGFAIYYRPKKGIKQDENRLEGRYNAGKTRFLFCFEFSKKHFNLPEYGDGLLAEALICAGNWSMEDKRLVFISGGTRFVFEKL